MSRSFGVRGRLRRLEEQVDELSDAVEENRRLNERLHDVLDVVTELLVPAMDREDERLKEALDRLLLSKQRQR